MNWLTEHPVLGWLALALALGVAEMATLDFIFVMLAGGALAGSLAAALGLGYETQIVVAVVAALLLLGLGRPIVLRKMRSGEVTLTGTAALVGREGLVLETVTSTGGRVKLGGEVWSARTAPHARPPALLPGASVRVLSIEGATALVVPTDPDETEMRPS